MDFREGFLCIVFLCIAFLLCSIPASAFSVRVDFKSRFENFEPPAKATIQWTRVDGIGDKGVSRMVANGQQIKLEPGLWKVRAAAEGFWAPEQIFNAESSQETWTIEWWRVGYLQARLDTSKETLPDEVTIRFRTSPESKETIEDAVLISCPVAESGIHCPVPASVPLDLRVRARGFISHFFWNLTLESGKSNNLGTLQFVPGASIVGWIHAPVRDFRFPDCKITLSPKGDSSGQRDFLKRRNLVADSKPNNRGFFELTGVPPGQYTLTIDHPAYALLRKSPIQVFPRAETEIRDLELLPPAELTVNIFPPVSPGGKPWRISLAKESDVPGHSDFQDEGVSQDGLWMATDLSPGHYKASIADSEGSRWDFQHISIEPGQVEASLDFLLDAHFIQGKVLYGDEPVEATVFFGGFFGARRVTAASDAQGSYSATLPRQENWKLAVDVPSLNLRRELPDIKFAKGLQDDVIEMDVELPDSKIDGVVIDEDGTPRKGVFLQAFRADGADSDATTSSQTGGVFVFHALEPGSWHLQAELRGQNLSSDLVQVNLQENNQTLEQQIVLRRKLNVQAQLLSSEGQPVVGARIFGLVEQDSYTLTNAIPEATTDVQGSFSLSIPSKAKGLLLTAMAPGFAMRQFHFDRQELDGQLLLTVDQIGGTVVLKEQSGGIEALYSVNLFKDRLLAHSYALSDWAKANGFRRDKDGPLTLPMLEPGRYTACAVRPHHQRIYLDGMIPNDESSCVSGELPAFGELVLTVPSKTVEDDPGPVMNLR